MDLSRFAKINVVQTPTPLEELVRLRRAIGCKPRIFVKRDDTTTVGLGGNKNRKLQYLMADAKAQNADTVITIGGVQSNHCRQTLAFAKLLGMECHLVLIGQEPDIYQGNALLFKLMGAELHFIEDGDQADANMDALANELRVAGKTPYVIPMGGSTPLGVLGYIESLQETLDQSQEFGVEFKYSFVATGSGGTQAGIEIGAREYCPSMEVHGVSVNQETQLHQNKLMKLVTETYQLFGKDQVINSAEFIVHDNFYGEGYAIPTEAGNRAISLCARTEGLVLDPVYTGKAMSAMIHFLEQGRLDDAEAVLFFHTGGFPALFAMAGQFQ